MSARDPLGDGGSDGTVTRVAGEATGWKGVMGASEMAQEASRGEQGRDRGLDRSGY